MGEKELFYEADTRKHQQAVAERMMACAIRLMKKGTAHDESKLWQEEAAYYVELVWQLHTQVIAYGSEEYKKVTAQMGPGWEHHKRHNDHHVEFFEQFAVQTLNDPVRAMDLFAFIEMLCDWIAAARRKDNRPEDAFRSLDNYIPSDSQLGAVLRNTLPIIERMATCDGAEQRNLKP